MDGSKADGGKAALAAQPTGSDAGEVARRRTPAPDGHAAAALDPPTAAGAEASGGEEVDDEQVERFYALLENIRAMRRAYTPGAGDETADGGSGGAARKRLRSADPPWRPAFRLEDFEDAAATTATSRRATTKKESDQLPADDGEKAAIAPPSSSQPPPPPPRSGARRVDSDSKSI